MDEAEALTVLREHMESYRGLGYGELAELVGKSRTAEARGASGVRYQVEVQVLWDEHPAGAVRVIGSIDDGGWRATKPLCEDFLASADEVICREHGRQGIGLACTHVAHAIDGGESVGFFWGDDTDTARPDAWCRACEQALLAVAAGHSTDAWFRACDFKVLCAACWDLAKQRLYGSR